MTNTITLAKVKRNGAKNRRAMADEFLKQSDLFNSPNYTLSIIMETLRSYERDGLFLITDTHLILNHEC